MSAPAPAATEPLPLSVFVIARNEADRIGQVLEAVRGLTDDLVVVDSGSTDATVAIAQAAGARVVVNVPWPGYGPQKRFAEDLCRHDWVLNLDADEVVTPALAREIAALMRAPERLRPAYRFRQVTVYPGKQRPRLWADYHNYVRLYDRRRARFRPSRVHDTVDTGNHPVGQLRGVALHYSWRSLEHLRAKLESYTDLQAKELRKPRGQILARLPFEYPLLLLRYYVLRRNFTGGLEGLKTAHVIAKARTGRLVKMPPRLDV
jgi:glycosyltransferase involved in cell wall biosynthesis